MTEIVNEQDYGTRTFNDIMEVYEYLNDYFKFPQTKALVPINPQKWVAHSAGSILAQEPES